MSQSDYGNTQWNNIYKIGGVAALSAVLVGILEIMITFLPGGNASQETVLEWFMLFQENWFMGLRNLGLLNIILNGLGILTFFALYAAHRQNAYRPYAMLAMIISLLGTGVFFATNRAFPILDLSKQYAAATSDVERAVLAAAGQAMLSVGQSHTPGTFLAFLLAEVAGIMISVVMLKSKIFSKATAYVGILGFGFFMVFEVLASFVSGLSGLAMVIAMLGGLLSMTWYILIARRLFQLGRSPLE